jgi:hypothetical protein
MSSGFKVVVALLIVVAIATVLISPDPADDVTGVLHQHLKLQKLAAIFAIAMRVPVSRFTLLALNSERTEGPLHDISSLFCVRLC